METDLTKITTPFVLLDDVTKTALQSHGGPYEMLCHSGEWLQVPQLQWLGANTYRVKPAPKRETVTRKGFVCASGWVSGYSLNGTPPVTVTFETVDGVMDLSTYRLEAR